MNSKILTRNGWQKEMLRFYTSLKYRGLNTLNLKISPPIFQFISNISNQRNPRISQSKSMSPFEILTLWFGWRHILSLSFVIIDHLLRVPHLEGFSPHFSSNTSNAKKWFSTILHFLWRIMKIIILTFFLLSKRPHKNSIA